MVVVKMRKIISLIVMLSCCGIIFAEGEQGLSQSNEAVVMEEAVDVSSKLKKIGNDTLFIIINDDAEYGKSFVSAHEPYWKESACMELKPGKAIKYRYKKQLAKKSKKDADDTPSALKMQIFRHREAMQQEQFLLIYHPDNRRLFQTD